MKCLHNRRDNVNLKKSSNIDKDEDMSLKMPTTGVVYVYERS